MRSRTRIILAVTLTIVATCFGFRADAVFVQEQKISATDFGLSGFYSIAISADGSRIAIGNQGAVGGGAVYLFRLSGGVWALEQTLTSSDAAAGDSFGISVSLTDDATRVLVGAHLNDDGGTSSGAAYVFSRSGTVWTEEQKLIASDDATGATFGEVLDIAPDGTRLVVGSKGIDSRGAAYVFSRSGTVWTEEQKVVASDRAIGDNYGYAVAMDYDGTRIIVGAPNDDASLGAAYVASRSGTVWAEEQKLTASDGVAGDIFGTAVDIASDGTRAVAGAGADDIGTETNAVPPMCSHAQVSCGPRSSS